MTPKLHVSEALLNPNTAGLVIPRFDLVVPLAECSHLRTAEEKDNRAAPILKKVAEWTIANALAGR